MMSDLVSSRVFLVASKEVSFHFTFHTQKHAGSLACVYECIPSLNSRPFWKMQLLFRVNVGLQANI